VHLVGFITRIYHNARSSECQMHQSTLHDKRSDFVYLDRSHDSARAESVKFSKPEEIHVWLFLYFSYHAYYTNKLHAAESFLRH